ncbi:AfsA-related hotdog domain-containing protein [Streptomyces sp. Q6]|uniref:AfsA-related hotdog domain-containing protein n=1 Tax=Streptomyces citrinus TaxID=3118173 RepID=A0ACD5AB80_9ACTN
MDPTLTLAPFFPGPQHLVHKPDSPEAYLLGAGTPAPQRFTFATELPDAHPLFDGADRPFHDLLFPVEALRRAALFAARQYFRVPEKRVTAMATAGTEITEVEAWRSSGAAGVSARISLDLTLTPVDVVTGVPRGMECEAVVAIDGRRCGTAMARLVFLSPGVHRAHRTAGRQQSERSLAGRPRAVTGSPTPEQVGRGAAHHVFVGLPVPDGDDTLVLPVDTAAAATLLGDGSDAVPPALFLEASRQAALIAAAELHGFLPAHAVLTRWRAAFRGYAEPELALHCAVRSKGTPVRDAARRPAIRLHLSFLQGDREVAQVAATVLQDC